MRIVAQQPKFMVRIKQRQPAPAAAKPRPLIQAGALPRSATPFEVVAHQVENRIRLRAFEEHGTDDARMDEPGDIESASTSKKSIEKTSDTPFLDLFYGRKFKLPVEAIPGVEDARSNKKRVSYTNSGTAKGNQLVRMDYYLFRLFLRAITPYEFSIPDLYFDNKESAGGVPLIQIFNQSAVKDNWRNLKVVKTTRGFSVDLPIVTVEQDLLLANLATLLNYSSPSRTEGYIETEISDATGAVTIDTENEYSFRVAALPRDDSKGFQRTELDYLAKADATVIVRNHDGVALSAVLRINCSRKESEYLLRQSFSEARPVDMLNLLLGSVQPKKTNNQHTTYNSATVPSCGFSLAKIARSLPEDSDSMRRTNDDDIVVDAAGDFFFLPKKLNNVPYYDETWLNVVDPESTGTTAYAGGPDVGRSAEAGVQKKISNIGSIPVLIDWQNLKFAYTNTNGALNVLDLDQVYTARAMHYSRFLREPVQGPLGGRLLNEIVDYLNIVGIDARNLGFPMERDYLNVVANSLGYIAQEDRARLPILAIPYTAKTYYEPDTSAEFEGRNGIYDPLDVSRKALQGQAQEQEYGPVEANKAPIPGSVGIMAAARALLEKLTNEPERFYRERAVTSVYSLRARLTVFIKGENLDELFERSRVEQAKYIAQKIDDNWEVEPLPLVTTENGGIKPQFHQKNCLNLTKENPDLAIYPASAGAGKTVLSILDVLRQIDRGETGPFIIACPASLVPDYVSEIAYVTAGKLNPIAITTDVWDTHARNIKGSLRSIVKSAPINTVLVVSYRTLILGSYDVCYGQETITVYPVIQFLRSFRPTYALFDECHTLRNKTSKVHKGAMRLMAGCRKKRLASGTMVANTLQDLVGQISLIDPTLFGSEEEFKEKYMEVVEGTKGKKRKPRPGAETAVKNLLFSNMVIAAADRKQWAYKLPKQKRSFLAVQLTPLQQVTHDFILQTVFSAIAPKSPDEEEGFVKTTPDEDASTKSQDRLAASISRGRERAADLIAKGAKLFNSDASIPDDLVDKDGNISLKGLFALARANQGKNTAVEPDDDDIGGDDDEDSGAKKEDDFINYLSVVETFISGPGDYEALMAFVSSKYNVPFLEVDLVSPKVGACISRIREHLQHTPQGKFIVFCNYNATREAIIRALPEDIKKVTINYMAEQKLTQRKEFTDNDEIRGLIGIEKSLSTGFNLQVGTRLIRVETVWTPADIEQGNSRINRPSVKKGEVRDRIYYDTIIADDSLDVAKVASLVSKQVAQIKFDQTEAVSLDDTSSTVKQTENPFFALETPDPFNLSPQGILDNCNVQEMNAKYLVPLENISKMLERTYAQFALDNKDKLFANPEIIQPAKRPEDTVFPKELIKKEDTLREKAPPAGSFVMYRIPYTLGMELYKADALGLVPYKKWLEEMGFSKFREGLGLSSSYRPEADVKFGTPAYAAGLKEHTAKLIEAEKNFALKHKPRIHTDLGDGILEGVYGTGIKIRLAATGYLQSVQRNKAFVITRTYTNVQDIRQALISNSKLPIKDANMRDMTPVPLDKLIQEEQSGRTKVRPTAPVQRPAAPVVTKPPVEVVDENAIPVSVVSINGYPSIQVDAELFKIADKKFVPAHPYGAKMNNKFGYAPASRTLYLIKPRDGADLAKVITLLEKNGFIIPPVLRTRLLDLRDHVAGGQGLIKKLEHMKLPALTADYITFLARQNNLKSEDGNDKLAIFPYIVDGNNFQFMLTKSSATEKAIALIRESSLAARVTIASRSQTKAAKVFSTADQAEEDLLALFEGKMIDKGTYESQLKKLAALQTVTPAEKLGPYKPLLPEYATAEENKKPAKPPAEKPAEVAPQKPTAPVQPAVTKPQAPQTTDKIDAEGEIISYSSFYGVEVKAETPEQVAALTELGFHKSSLRYVVVRTLQQFREAARACSRNGYALPPENRAAMLRVNKLWGAHPRPDDLLDFSSKRHTELQVDMEMKFNLAHPEKDHEGNNYPPNTKFVFAIPIVTDTEVRLAVPNAHQDSVDALVSVIKPITNTPIRFDNKNKYILLCEDVEELLATLKELDTVFNLVNRSDMIKQYREIKSSAN